MKPCRRCRGPLSWYDTRRHCFPCIMRALMRWPSLHIFRRRDRREDRRLIQEINKSVKLKSV